MDIFIIAPRKICKMLSNEEEIKTIAELIGANVLRQVENSENPDSNLCIYPILQAPTDKLIWAAPHYSEHEQLGFLTYMNNITNAIANSDRIVTLLENIEDISLVWKFLVVVKNLQRHSELYILN